MSGYSSIFSSGLLATPRPYRRGHGEPSSRASSPDIMAIDTTPTNSKSPHSLPPPDDDASDYFSPSRSRASSNASSIGQPRLRRRRSSLTVASSGISAIKSPMRSAGAALQRNSLMIPGLAQRSRSGTIDVVTGMEDFGTTPNPMTGRMRSGSAGTASRPRRAIRKPATAPPTMPLPPPPSSAPASESSFRRPLSYRAHTTDNYTSFSATLGPGYLTPDFTNKLVAAMNTPPANEGAMFWDDGTKEN